MTPAMLYPLGIASLIFVILFTWRAYYHVSPIPGQTPRSAIIEAWCNIIIGFSFNYMANFFILPMVHAHFTSLENFMMGWIYTAISMVRTYTIRRWFNARIHRFAQILAAEGDKND